jgi:prevent-host-death family protein
VNVKKLSLAEAKAHISEIVDLAEHRGRRTIILRDGKPVAAIVPLDVAMPPSPPRPRHLMPDVKRSVREFVTEFSRSEPEVSAVDELLRERR